MFTLIAIGKMRNRSELELFERHAKRIRPHLNLIEVQESKGLPKEIKLKETQNLLKQIPERSLVIALDEGGTAYNSLDFAKKIQKWSELSKPISFVIGGAEGLHSMAIEAAHSVLSLGRCTWPHMLVRILLSEQIYRAQAIIQGHPYHRQGRP